MLVAIGVAIVVAAESLRLWAVRHIGAISRTRSERLGPLVSTGPFASVRNPLYLGNIALWVGFALSARLLWLAPLFLVVLALEYHAIVRWEEELLTSRRGEDYREYLARVPRWLPVVSRQSSVVGPTPSVVSRESSVADSETSDVSGERSGGNGTAAPFSWRDTLFSERGTLLAIAVGYVLLWIKSQL
jgi:hypothetical protein